MSVFAEPADLAINFRELEPVEVLAAPPQEARLFRHPRLGRVLTIGEEVQHVEAWQALYHEPLVHLASAFVPVVERVLILGGGSLYAAAEALRYRSVKHCTLVDHDRRILELVGRHYAHAQAVLGDLRFEYVQHDALSFLRNSEATFDLIVNDCFDTLELGKMAGCSVFDLLKRRLTVRGVCTDLIFRHLLANQHVERTRLALQAVGPHALSLIFIPEYPGVLHFLTIWGSAEISQNLKESKNIEQRSWRAQTRLGGLQFFDPSFLRFFLYLPPFARKIWQS